MPVAIIVKVGAVAGRGLVSIGRVVGAWTIRLGKIVVRTLLRAYRFMARILARAVKRFLQIAATAARAAIKGAGKMARRALESHKLRKAFKAADLHAPIGTIQKVSHKLIGAIFGRAIEDIVNEADAAAALASDPYGPPARRTGGLIDGLDASGHLIVSNAPYSANLELGTANVAPRPFMFQGIDMGRDQAMNVLEDTIEPEDGR